MKNIFLSLILFSVFSGCKKDDSSSNSPSPSNTPATYSFSFKFDGTPYSWSGSNLVAGYVDGQATYSMNAIALLKGPATANEVTITIKMSNFSVGTFNLPSGSQTDNFSCIINSNALNYTSTIYGGAMQVNITSISSITWPTNPPGKVNGTFSGTIEDVNGGSHSITDGKFEAARMN